jgi:hypothetical protein
MKSMPFNSMFRSPYIPSPIRSLLLILCLTSYHSVTVAQDPNKPATNPSGTWRWEYEFEGQQLKDQLRLQVKPGNESAKERIVEGKYESTSGRKRDIQNGKVIGSTITFDFSIDYKGMDVTLAFEGTIKNDSLTGNVKASSKEGSLDLPWNATRSVQNDDVVGTWKLRIDANGQLLEPTVILSKEGDGLKARYKSPGNVALELDAQKVKIDKNELCFSIETDFQGTKIKADFMGRPYGDSLRGTIDYVLGDDVGEVDFTGTREKQ